MKMPQRAPAAGETPPPATVERRGSRKSRWLAALSEPYLDLLTSLKMLAVKRAETAGRPHLADAFDLCTLRAIGVIDVDYCGPVGVVLFNHSEADFHREARRPRRIDDRPGHCDAGGRRGGGPRCHRPAGGSVRVHRRLNSEPW